ncbi:MAG: hypothetical protein NUV65_06865 [Candidatus Roizmanbacteria bacterium]|nr:hypothetical protein [Candidatus Roizmanbacteria bacterium]
MKKEKYTWNLASQANGCYGVSTKILTPIEVIIGAGTQDTVTVYSELLHGKKIYIIFSVNYALDYCGIEIYSATGGFIAEVFLQTDTELEDVLGERGLELSELTMAERMYNFLLETDQI